MANEQWRNNVRTTGGRLLTLWWARKSAVALVRGTRAAWVNSVLRGARWPRKWIFAVIRPDAGEKKRLLRYDGGIAFSRANANGH